MLVRTQFVFLDFGEPKLRFYLDYLAMMGCVRLFRALSERPACEGASGRTGGEMIAMEGKQ